MKIIINTKAIEVEPSLITYEDVVALAGKKGYPTVTYYGPIHGDSYRSGSMYLGCKPVELEPDMVFTVMHTNNA